MCVIGHTIMICLYFSHPNFNDTPTNELSLECLKLHFCNHRKPILQNIRKTFCSRNHFPFFHISLCVVLLLSFCLHSQPIRVILHEIRILKGAQGNKGAKSKAKSKEKENFLSPRFLLYFSLFFFLLAFRLTFRSLVSLCSIQNFHFTKYNMDWL